MEADMNTVADLSSSGSEASLLNNQMKKIFEIEIGKQEAGKEGGVREKKEYKPCCTIQLCYTNHKLSEAHTSPSAGRPVLPSVFKVTIRGLDCEVQVSCLLFHLPSRKQGEKV